jgi:hypothetical protein
MGYYLEEVVKSGTGSPIELGRLGPSLVKNPVPSRLQRDARLSEQSSHASPSCRGRLRLGVAFALAPPPVHYWTEIREKWKQLLV